MVTNQGWRRNIMEIMCVPRLSREQERRLPMEYVRPAVEGMCIVDDAHPEGLIVIFVGYCSWETDFDYCLREFVLTVFHEIMHVLFPDIDDYVPYAEKLLAEILSSR
jgi:hypothetical protein